MVLLSGSPGSENHVHYQKCKILSVFLGTNADLDTVSPFRGRERVMANERVEPIFSRDSIPSVYTDGFILLYVLIFCEKEELHNERR